MKYFKNLTNNLISKNVLDISGIGMEKKYESTNRSVGFTNLLPFMISFKVK